MVKYNQKEKSIINFNNSRIYSFINNNIDENIDLSTVKSFGEEWSKFSTFNNNEIQKIGDEYFDIINSKTISKDSLVLDLGCGSGRWSKYLSNKVKFIEAIDPSSAVIVASKLLKNEKNIRVSKASVDNIPFDDYSFDLAISLGVLHHIPDTESALKKLVKKVKINGHVLIYLYYKLDNRKWTYKLIFQLSCIPRFIISKMPKFLKHISCEIIAFTVYLPLISLSKLFKFFFKNNFYKKIPLSYYIGKSLNVIRNDALDRFGTPLEQRFTKKQINEMMKNAGLDEIVFSNNEPYWHAVGKRIE